MKTFWKAILPAILIASTSYADKLIVLENPIESLEARVELIMNAKKTIDVQYFTVEHDYISISGLALLREAARRGVKVRVIVDSMHNLMTREMMSAVLDNLGTGEKNIEIKEFNQFNIFRPFCYTRRMHDKSLIIDGQYLIVGDRNVANGYYDIPDMANGESLPQFQGVDALLEGQKSIGEATAYFNQRWNSRDVKPVQLYNYSASNLDYSYCSYSEDYSTCEMRRQQDVVRIKAEMSKLDHHYAQVSAKNSKVLAERPTLKALATAHQTDNVRFIHDDATRRVCKGKNPEMNISKTLYEDILENTKKDLIIITPYLTVTPEMEAVIKKLVEEKDVFVRFITNSPRANDVPAATAGYLKTRSRLMNIKNKESGRGVRLYEFENISNPVLKDVDGNVVASGKAISTVHAKVVLMDSKRAFIGSKNWDYRSQNLNSEVGVIVDLEGGKSGASAADIRSRAAQLLHTSKIVRQDGTKNSEIKLREVLNDIEKRELKGIVESREAGTELWNFLLDLPVIGQLLLEQT